MIVRIVRPMIRKVSINCQLLIGCQTKWKKGDNWWISLSKCWISRIISKKSMLVIRYLIKLDKSVLRYRMHQWMMTIIWSPTILQDPYQKSYLSILSKNKKLQTPSSKIKLKTTRIKTFQDLLWEEKSFTSMMN